MTATLILLELAGYVVLLLWGTRMVQSGMERAFGSRLRDALGVALRRRIVALGAGVGVTLVLQSSTATALMTASFAARAAVPLVPALAVMLGANIGTALIVRVFAFDLAALVPVLMIIGYVAFKRSRKGWVHDLGRVLIGLGLMLLALRSLVAVMQPVGTAPALGQVLSVLTAEPVLDLLVGALLAWAAHSSVAVMLLLVNLAAAHVIAPAAAVALVLGANLGGAIPPLLASVGLNPANKRVPAGNLAFRAIGCLAVLPFTHPLAELLWTRLDGPVAAVTSLHIGFNIIVAAVFLPLLDQAAGLLSRIFPDIAAPDDLSRPQHLDPEALETPYLALAHAAREMLRMGDAAEAMLKRLPATLGTAARLAADEIGRSAKGLRKLQEAVKSYLASIDSPALTARDRARLETLQEFAVNLVHAADITHRFAATAAARSGGPLNPDDRAVLDDIHAQVLADLRLALSAMMTGDPRSARELIDAKRRINDQTRSAARTHLARPGSAGQPGSTVFLNGLRDLKRANSHLAGIAYAVLDQPGPAEEEDA